MYIRLTRAQYADPATLDSEAATQLWQELSTHVRGLPGNQSYTGGSGSRQRADNCDQHLGHGGAREVTQ